MFGGGDVCLWEEVVSDGVGVMEKGKKSVGGLETLEG